MREHTVPIADYCSASCPNPSGGNPEFMESMTFWLNSLSIVVVGVTIVVAIISIVIGFLGFMNLKDIKNSARRTAAKTAARVAKEFMLDEKVTRGTARQFKQMPDEQPQNKEEENNE